MEVVEAPIAPNAATDVPAEPDDGTAHGPAQSVICVVGMHRSGTSLVTRIMNLVGVDLGRDDQIMPPDSRANPTGFWENSGIVKLNDDLLEALGGSWDHPPRLEDGWEYGQRATAFRSRARALAAEITRSSSAAGWKDPRMSLLLPFWKTVVPVASTVLVIRHPFQVVGSLEARDGITAEEGALLWSRYVVAAWRSHPHRMLVNYDDALEDAASCAVHLAKFLGLDDPSRASLDAVSAFVDRSLCHHQNHFPDVAENMALALAIYAVVESQPFAMIDGILEAIHRQWLQG